MLVICGVMIAVIVLLCLNPLLQLFGVTEDILPYAQDYTGITAFGIPFFILTTGGTHIVRADRSPTYSMTCILTGAIINTILDPLFIFVFGWGIKGAAWATVIGQMMSGLLVILYFLKCRKMDLKAFMLIPKWEYIQCMISLGMAACINQLAMALVQIVMNNTLKYYGASSVYGSEIPLACVGVISKVNMVFISISIGLAQGCQPIWGFNYGAKRYDRVCHTYKRAFQMALVVGIVFFLSFQIFPRQIISIFGAGSEEYYQFATRYFKIYMLFTFANGLHPVSSNFFTSMGKAKLGAVVSLTRQVLFLMPLILIFPVFLGIDGVMYAGPIADGAAIIVSLSFAYQEIKRMRKL